MERTCVIRRFNYNDEVQGLIILTGTIVAKAHHLRRVAIHEAIHGLVCLSHGIPFLQICVFESN